MFYILHLSLNTVSIFPFMSFLKLTWLYIWSFSFLSQLRFTTLHITNSNPSQHCKLMSCWFKNVPDNSVSPQVKAGQIVLFLLNQKKTLSTIYLLKARDILFLRLILPLCLIPLPPSSQLISSCSFSNCLYSFLCRQSTLELQTKVPEDYTKFYNHERVPTRAPRGLLRDC